MGIVLFDCLLVEEDGHIIFDIIYIKKKMLSLFVN